MPLGETIERTVEGVERSADEGRGLRRAALGERARELAADLGLDEPRLLQEIARVVDRSDISEELQRLRGHVAHAREVMRDGVPAGKTLDFLAQEMAREANTIAAKSPAGGAGREVITLRAEIERLREQVQNVE